MVLLEINIPQGIEVADYHEFAEIGRYLKLLNPKIKVKEIGFNGDYLGIIYMGKLTDDENAAMIKAIKKELEKNDSRNTI